MRVTSTIARAAEALLRGALEPVVGKAVGDEQMRCTSQASPRKGLRSVCIDCKLGRVHRDPAAAMKHVYPCMNTQCSTHLINCQHCMLLTLLVRTTGRQGVWQRLLCRK